MKILILYHSGAGNTKLVSEILLNRLKQTHQVEISHVKKEYENTRLQQFDLLIFGFPTHHAAPTLTMTEYINRLNKFDQPIKSFIFTTYGLYPGNSLRIMAKLLQTKNIKVIDYEEFKAPATDGVLLFTDKLKFMFEFEKKLQEKINRFVAQIENFQNLTPKKLPPYKWYEPLNNLVKPLGMKYYEKLKSQMHIDPDLCTNCNLCVTVCDRSAWQSGNPIPEFVLDNCEFCLECVHKCPTQAIIFSDFMKDKPRLNKRFYHNLKKTIMK